jgi:hypothetical protein
MFVHCDPVRLRVQLPCQHAAVCGPGTSDFDFIAERNVRDRRDASKLQAGLVIPPDSLTINDQVVVASPFQIPCDVLGLATWISRRCSRSLEGPGLFDPSFGQSEAIRFWSA